MGSPAAVTPCGRRPAPPRAYPGSSRPRLRTWPSRPRSSKAPGDPPASSELSTAWTRFASPRIRPSRSTERPRSRACDPEKTRSPGRNAQRTSWESQAHRRLGAPPARARQGSPVRSIGKSFTAESAESAEKKTEDSESSRRSPPRGGIAVVTTARECVVGTGRPSSHLGRQPDPTRGSHGRGRLEGRRPRPNPVLTNGVTVGITAMSQDSSRFLSAVSAVSAVSLSVPERAGLSSELRNPASLSANRSGSARAPGQEPQEARRSERGALGHRAAGSP